MSILSKDNGNRPKTPELPTQSEAPLIRTYEHVVDRSVSAAHAYYMSQLTQMTMGQSATFETMTAQQGDAVTTSAKEFENIEANHKFDVSSTNLSNGNYDNTEALQAAYAKLNDSLQAGA